MAAMPVGKRTRYEDAWDRYSREWSERAPGRTALGEEWGTDDLTARIHEKFLLPHLGPDKRVLEIGPGGGKYSVGVAPHCKELICADVSHEMLSRVKHRLEGKGTLLTRKLDGLDLCGVDDESVDLAFAIDVFVHLDLEDIYGYLREFRRILVEGGTVVLHFASFLTADGWNLFHREADINRAQFKQMGRINLVTPEMVRRLFEKLRFEAIEIDEEIAPRDFLVRATKPALPPDPGREDRQRRILARTGARGLHLDLIQRLPSAIIAAPTDDYVARYDFDHGGDRREVLFAHSPARVGFALTVPRGASLHTACALHPEANERGARGGVLFRIEVNRGMDKKELFAHVLDPGAREEDRGWHDLEVSLAPYEGKVIFLVLETAIAEGPNDFNWSGWGEPALVLR
jgi:ubiquinone/menaquinone biosynthesis C-methylase UbiE